MELRPDAALCDRLDALKRQHCWQGDELWSVQTAEAIIGACNTPQDDRSGGVAESFVEGHVASDELQMFVAELAILRQESREAEELRHEACLQAFDEGRALYESEAARHQEEHEAAAYEELSSLREQLIKQNDHWVSQFRKVRELCIAGKQQDAELHSRLECQEEKLEVYQRETDISERLEHEIASLRFECNASSHSLAVSDPAR